MPFKFPRIDKEHSHCLECGGVFRDVALFRGMCSSCAEDMNESSKVKVAQAGTKAIAKASTQFLAAMQAQGKTGADMPQVMSAFWKKIGGQEAYGEILGEQFQNAMGIGITEEEYMAGGFNAKLAKDFLELTMRHIDRADANKSLDVGSLEEADLENILIGVGTKAVLEDPSIRKAVVRAALEEKTFRRRIFREILAQDKELLEQVLRDGGILTLEADDVIEEDDTVSPPEDYDPSADEYRDD